MIPRAHVTAWRSKAPWPTDAQVEQDLVLSRALVEMFDNPFVAKTVGFRGGTALHKLFFERPGRYSEDIDLVQIEASAIGPALDAIRAALDPWLGQPSRKRAHGRATLLYRFDTSTLPVQRLRLKVEINTREHFSVFGVQPRRLAIESPWFSGWTDVATYAIEELLATKLRALYQRRKGRDLFDLWLALKSLAIDDEKVVACFGRHLDQAGTTISRAEFEANLSAKLGAPAFLDDLAPLLPTGVHYDVAGAAELVQGRLLARLRGDPWKGGEP